MTVEPVVAEALNPAFLRDGVTLSGGEPFLQPEAMSAIVRAFKDRGQHVIAYTGYTPAIHMKNWWLTDTRPLRGCWKHWML